MRIKVTTLSPIHIGDGNSYVENFNFVRDGDDIYIFDEFKVLEYFISKKFLIPQSNIERFFSNQKNNIIKNELYKRKIKSFFKKNEILTNISSQNNPIIPGSSIKGAIETAVFSLLAENSERVEIIKNALQDRQINKNRFNQRKPHTIDSDFKKIFTYLKVSDSFEALQTQIYKTINIKKDKSNQGSRENKLNKIANYVESIIPNQTFEITIKDESDKEYRNKLFSNLVKICNGYYLPKINQDIKYYFYKKNFIKLSRLGEKRFLLNLGRFGGAEKKTIDSFRYIKNSHCDDKTKTSAVTFALEKNGTSPYFENELLPFGWVVCEILD